MPMPAPRKARVMDHPGSSADEIANEPDWGSGHNHRVGFRNRHDRLAGLTHDGDHGYEDEEERQFVEAAVKKHRDLLRREKRGDMVNFQDVMKAETVSVLVSISVMTKTPGRTFINAGLMRIRWVGDSC